MNRGNNVINTTSHNSLNTQRIFNFLRWVFAASIPALMPTIHLIEVANVHQRILLVCIRYGLSRYLQASGNTSERRITIEFTSAAARVEHDCEPKPARVKSASYPAAQPRPVQRRVRPILHSVAPIAGIFPGQFTSCPPRASSYNTTAPDPINRLVMRRLEDGQLVISVFKLGILLNRSLG